MGSSYGHGILPAKDFTHVTSFPSSPKLQLVGLIIPVLCVTYLASER